MKVTTEQEPAIFLGARQCTYKELDKYIANLDCKYLAISVVYVVYLDQLKKIHRRNRCVTPATVRLELAPPATVRLDLAH